MPFLSKIKKTEGEKGTVIFECQYDTERVKKWDKKKLKIQVSI